MSGVCHAFSAAPAGQNQQGGSCWGGGYDEDGCWDDARAQRALRTTREAREDAKKAEAERKRAAALAQQAARRTAARPPPAKRPRAATAVAPAAARARAAPAAPPAPHRRRYLRVGGQSRLPFGAIEHLGTCTLL